MEIIPMLTKLGELEFKPILNNTKGILKFL